MGTPAELNQFLASVEKKAFAMAMAALKNQEDALDVVQDVMLTLANKYADKPVDQWTPLFFRMLKNRITDFHRAATTKRKFFGWFARTEEDDSDPMERVEGRTSDQPDVQLTLDGVREDLVDALDALPERQREAFELRVWQGLDVRQTAKSMGVSEGSVKTHLSRAVHTLREALSEYSYD